MDIKQLSVTELKSMAYDQLVLIEQARLNLSAINAELQARANKLDLEENGRTGSTHE